MEYKNKTFVIILPIIFAGLLIVGIIIGNKLSAYNHDNTYTIYPKTDKLNAIIDYISENYVDSLSRDKIIEKAIPELLKQLDPHSIYIPAQDMESVNEPLVGNFDGIGIQFNIQKDTIVVINTISGGPSEKVGIKAGDRIVKVNDTLIAGINISNKDVVKKLRGKRDSEVFVDIKRSSSKDLINYKIIRGKIPLHSVDVSYMIDDEIGYIKISKFARTTYSEFKEAVEKLKVQGLKNIILDLRGNGGGFLDAATNIIDEFLDENQVIVYTKGKNSSKRIIQSTKGGICKDNKVVVLIDEWSASASEIVAGAIQDNDRGTIIGRRSFGKGLVQEPTFFKDGSGLRLTIARYYTPTGRCIQKSYSEGIDSYEFDIGNRYVNGELLEKDSIHFPDSLKYKTPKGKVVYGGGGIMPDYFIPIDTTYHTMYLTNVINHGLIYQFAFNYTDKNRNKLNKLTGYKAIAKYLNNQKIYKLFNAYSKNKGFEPSEYELQRSDRIITVYLKAYILRNLIDDNGFYPMLNTIDKSVIKAKQVLKQ